jgi:nitrate reductase gamma subunit
MLTPKEIEFLNNWTIARNTYKKSFLQYIKGISVGLIAGVAIIVVVASGWYQRANMQANAKLSSMVFILALLIICVFMGWLYRNYMFEMKEQQYKELLYKQQQQSNKKPQ